MSVSSVTAVLPAVDPPASKVDWLAQLAAGSDAALTHLIREWGPALHRFVYRYVQDASVAEDLVQETFVRVYRQRERYRPGKSPSAWLFTIAANLCHNHRRWQGRHPTVPLAVTDEPPGSGPQAAVVAAPGSPRERALQSETVAAVRAAIDDLPHDMKSTLLLFEFDELSYTDIAQVVGCSPRGVETRLTRARARLRSALGALWQEVTQRRRSDDAPVVT